MRDRERDDDGERRQRRAGREAKPPAIGVELFPHARTAQRRQREREGRAQQHRDARHQMV